MKQDNRCQGHSAVLSPGSALLQGRWTSCSVSHWRSPPSSSSEETDVDADGGGEVGRELPIS